jgi:hypothetical protein
VETTIAHTEMDYETFGPEESHNSHGTVALKQPSFFSSASNKYCAANFLSFNGYLIFIYIFFI